MFQEEYVITADNVSTAAQQLHAELTWLRHAPDLLLTEVYNSPSCITHATIPSVATLEQIVDENAQLLQDLRHSRLGRHFESLVACQLALLPETTRIIRNLPIRSQTRTLGELDFLFCYRHHWYHLEVALKLYLHTAPDAGLGGYIGLQTRDTLANKWERLCSHQLTLCRQTETRTKLAELGITEQPTPIPLFKGWLFYHCSDHPGAYPLPIAHTHARGWWIYEQEIGWLDHQGKAFRVLCKADWLLPADLVRSTDAEFPATSSPVLSLTELAAWLQQHHAGVLVSVIEFDRGYAQETSRGFIVSDDWNRGH